MSERYRTSAINRDGVTGRSLVPGGLSVAVASPLDPAVDPAASNPEQLLALAWATCLNATAQTILGGERRTQVRVEVVLRDADEAVGFEFDVTAYLSAEGLTLPETEDRLAGAHARCPVSRLLRTAATARVTAELYV